MSIIFLLIPLSILIAGCFLGAFVWAVRNGQYEDTCTPAMRMLWDDAIVHRREGRTSDSVVPCSDQSTSPERLEEPVNQ